MRGKNLNLCFLRMLQDTFLLGMAHLVFSPAKKILVKNISSYFCFSYFVFNKINVCNIIIETVPCHIGNM